MQIVPLQASHDSLNDRHEALPAEPLDKTSQQVFLHNIAEQLYLP
jgi:hypothetical protein